MANLNVLSDRYATPEINTIAKNQIQAVSDKTHTLIYERYPLQAAYEPRDIL